MISLDDFAAVTRTDLTCVGCTMEFAAVFDSHSMEPLCFRCAFIVVLTDCQEAQNMALGFAVGYAYQDRYVDRRGNGSHKRT